MYYPGPSQIQTVMQQGELFSKQHQLFSVVEMGPSSLLTVDLDVEVTLPVPAMMVKKLANDVLEHLAANLKTRSKRPPVSRIPTPSWCSGVTWVILCAHR